MKIFIAYHFNDGPWGGGNQFLKNLKTVWEEENHYTNDIQNADVILFNSHQNLDQVVKLKKKYAQKIFIHRIDGPISQYRGRNIFLDKLIFLFAQELADGVIFQSKWSLEESKQLGFKTCRFQKIIHNAADPKLFYSEKNSFLESHNVTKLIATSWSENPKKGLDIYKYLDENLNFDEYEFTFLGASSVKFKNIHTMPPVSSKEVGHYLRKNHIFISGSEREACSNSIIEALCCGLPVVYRDSSSSETVKQAGLAFCNGDEALVAINAIREQYMHYHDAIEIQSPDEIAGEYSLLSQQILEEQAVDNYVPKKNGVKFMIKYQLLRALTKLNDIFYLILSKLKK